MLGQVIVPIIPCACPSLGTRGAVPWRLNEDVTTSRQLSKQGLEYSVQNSIPHMHGPFRVSLFPRRTANISLFALVMVNCLAPVHHDPQPHLAHRLPRLLRLPRAPAHLASRPLPYHLRRPQDTTVFVYVFTTAALFANSLSSHAVASASAASSVPAGSLLDVSRRRASLRAGLYYVRRCCRTLRSSCFQNRPHHRRQGVFLKGSCVAVSAMAFAEAWVLEMPSLLAGARIWRGKTYHVRNT